MNFKKLIRLSENKFFRVAVFIFVLYSTFVLRAHNYEKVPTANHLDEMLYAWSGIYLIETGMPVSWSTLDYPKRAEVYKGVISYKGGIPAASVTLYRPWLDEPPLFSLLVGSFAHGFGADRNQFIPSSYIRYPMVFIGALTSIFVFLIARFVSGYWIGILSMGVFGTVPLLVIASRTAMPENLIALALSITIYLLLLFQKYKKLLLVLPIPLLVGVAGLSKPTGYFILPLAIFLIFYFLRQEKKVKESIYYCLFLILGTLPFIAAFFAYGFLMDAEIFKNITLIQSHRPAGFNSLMWYFISPSFDTQIFRDGWFVFLLLSAAFFIFSPKEGLKKLISFCFIYWVVIVMISSGENDLLAWYRFPTYPMLAILGAWGLEYIVKKADFFVSFLSAGLLLGNRALLVNAFRPNIDAMSYRLIFSGLMLPSLFNFVFDRKKIHQLSQIVIVAVIMIGVWINVKYIYNAYEIPCENKTCPLVPPTNLSTIHPPFFWRFLILGEPTYR